MHVISFDIEEWYIYELYRKGEKSYYLPILEKLLENILEILDERSITATFFCLGIIAREYPEVVNEIARRGHEIACHSDKHSLCTELTPYEFEEDLKRAVYSLEDTTGKRIISFRAPSFSLTEETKWIFEILSKHGIKNDCSVFLTNRTNGGYPSFRFNLPVKILTGSDYIYEFQVTAANYMGRLIPFSGGGYFRFLPYSVIKSLMDRNCYVMSYFHLRDFDTKQKEIISWRYLKSYYGIKGMLSKLEKFLSDFQFMSVSQAMGLLEKQHIQEVASHSL